MTNRRTALLISACLLAGCGGESQAPQAVAETAPEPAPPAADPCAPGSGERLLHVPSPDWRDQVVYMIFTDRFHDGDPSNNDMGKGEFVLRGSVDSNFVVKSVIEKKLLPLPFTLALCSMLNHRKNQYQFGCGLIIG